MESFKIFSYTSVKFFQNFLQFSQNFIKMPQELLYELIPQVSRIFLKIYAIFPKRYSEIYQKITKNLYLFYSSNTSF